MRVKELIEILKIFSPELDVAVTDWNEDYAIPNGDVFDYIQIKHCSYTLKGENKKSNVLMIGK